MAQLPEPALADGDTGTVGRDDELIAPDGDFCPVCHDLFDRPTRTVCKHWFCLCAALLIYQDHSKAMPVPAVRVTLTGWTPFSSPALAGTLGFTATRSLLCGRGC